VSGIKLRAGAWECLYVTYACMMCVPHVHIPVQVKPVEGHLLQRFGSFAGLSSPLALDKQRRLLYVLTPEEVYVYDFSWPPRSEAAKLALMTLQSEEPADRAAEQTPRRTRQIKSRTKRLEQSRVLQGSLFVTSWPTLPNAHSIAVDHATGDVYVCDLYTVLVHSAVTGTQLHELHWDYTLSRAVLMTLDTLGRVYTLHTSAVDLSAGHASIRREPTVACWAPGFLIWKIALRAPVASTSTFSSTASSSSASIKGGELKASFFQVNLHTRNGEAELVVLDSVTHMVHIFDAQGNLLRSFQVGHATRRLAESATNRPNQPLVPEGLAVDGSRFVYISINSGTFDYADPARDSNVSAIEVYTYSGRFVKIIGVDPHLISLRDANTGAPATQALTPDGVPSTDVTPAEGHRQSRSTSEVELKAAAPSTVHARVTAEAVTVRERSAHRWVQYRGLVFDSRFRTLIATDDSETLKRVRVFA